MGQKVIRKEHDGGLGRFESAYKGFGQGCTYRLVDHLWVVSIQHRHPFDIMLLCSKSSVRLAADLPPRSMHVVSDKGGSGTARVDVMSLSP